MAGILLTLLAATAVTANSARAKPVNPDLYSGLSWRLVGPFRGGRALAVSGVPGHPLRFYFGAVDGGVWETNDAGRTWKPIFDDQPVASIGAIAVAPSNPNVIYVGTGEADMRSDIAFGNGVYKSTDGGKTWRHIGLTDTRHIGTIVVDPHDPDNVFVAALGHAFGPNAQRGVFHSTDGGKTWRKSLYKNENTGAIDLALDPSDPDVIYAALWQARRPPWAAYPPSNGPGSGLYKSADGGKSWTEISGHGFPSQVGRIGLAVAASSPQRVYALVGGSKQGGLYRSDDGGEHWQLVNDNQKLWRRGFYFGHVSVSPADPDIVYIPNTALYRSTDGGRHFKPIKGSPGGDDYHRVWIDPEHPHHLIVGSDQGVVVSLNNGETWSSWYNQPTAQFYHVSTDNRFEYWLYGAQQDTGAHAVPIRTDTPDGITLKNLHGLTAGYENGYIVPSARNPNVVFGSGGLGVTRTFHNTSENQKIDPTLGYPGHYRGTWVLPLALSPTTHALYFANQRMFRSRDGGESWQPISPDLSRKNPRMPATVGAVTAKDSPVNGPRRGVIFSIAPSPLKAHEIWAGTDDGLIWITHDGGEHWQNVTPDGLRPWSKVSIIEASRYDAGTAYAAVDRHKVDDDTPYIYRTTDGGQSWTSIVDGIPDGDFVRVVREDPKQRGLLYAGTEKGIFISFDNGDRWQPLQLNLPVTSIRDIAIHGNDLIVATHGRAFWAMDDISALRQIAKNADRPAVRLFKPAVAYILHPPAFINTPFPKDEPNAENPPNGAIIDYYLKTQPAQPVVVEILDSRGRVVRRLSSADDPVKLDASELTVAPAWLSRIRPPAGPQASPGMHRLVWDLRYALPAGLQQKPSDYHYHFGNAGVWAPPGQYTVKLTVGTHSVSQPLIVKPDPRMDVTPEGLVRQFKFVRKIERRRLQIASLLAAAAQLQAALASRRSHADDRSLVAAIDALKDKVQSVTGPVSAGFRGHGNLSLTSLAYLKGAFETLEDAADSAEAAPTQSYRTGFKKLSRNLQVALTQWKEIKATGVPRLNKQLERSGQPAVTLH